MMKPMNKFTFQLIALGLLFAVSTLLPVKSWAILDLIVKEELKVHKKPSSKSKVITTLSNGDKVVVSPQEYGSWRKVLVTFQGKRSGGYIKAKKLRLSRIKERFEESTNFLLHNDSFSFNLIANYTSKSTRKLDTADPAFPNAQIETQQGIATSFGLSYQTPISALWLLELSLEQRQIFTSGAVDLLENGTVKEMDFREDMIALSAFLKMYSKASSTFWWGVGAGVGKVTNQSLILQNGIGVLAASDKPLYIYGTLGVGWDIPLKNQKYYIVPQAKTQFYFGHEGMIPSVELGLNLSWIY